MGQGLTQRELGRPGRFGTTTEKIDVDDDPVRSRRNNSNIRELENIVKRAYYLSTDRRLRFSEQLFPEFKSNQADSELTTLKAMQIHHIERVLEHCQGQIAGEDGAARILGLNESTLRSMMKRLGIDS